jgi:hypothetical protein
MEKSVSINGNDMLVKDYLKSTESTNPFEMGGSQEANPN